MRLSEPLVTVIMPIRNEAAFIGRSLGAILEQDYPADRLEILIADGMSDDATIAIIRALPGAERVRIIPNPKRLQAAAINVAIPQARGDIIIRVDGHTVIAPDYVRQCVAALAETGADNVGGAMDPVGDTPMGQAIAAAGKSPFAVPTAFHVSSEAQYTDTVYMGAWRREVFERAGLFNETFKTNEDYELNYRIRQTGGKIYFTPAIKSRYYGRQTLRALARQYYHYGIGKTRTLKAHPASLKPRQVVAPLFVLGLISGALLSRLHVVFYWLWLAGIRLYCCANALFSLRATSGMAANVRWRVPIVFLTIHLAWGIGFWVGLFQHDPESRPQSSP